MKKFNLVLKTIMLLQLIFNVSFGQKPDSKYLIKPMNEYSLSENTEASKPGYSKIEKIYSVQASLNSAWNFYNTLNTKEAWNSEVSKYQLSYDSKLGSYDSARSSSFDTLKTGKVFLVELTFLKWVKIPVIFQITKIDSTNKIIEFTYMKENKSNGFQTLQFSEKNGITFIKHISYYRSDNKLRDRFIYPTFHLVATDDFHAHIFMLFKKKIERQKKETNSALAADSDCLNEGSETENKLVQK